MSKSPHSPRDQRAVALWLPALAMMAVAMTLAHQPAAAAEEELIILSLHDSNGDILDAVAAMDDPDKDKDKGLSIIMTDEGADARQFYSGEAYADPLDSTCAGVDFSQAQWYGTMALITAGDKTFKRMVYRMGAPFDSKKKIKKIFAATVKHCYFREINSGDGANAPNGALVRATGSGTPPSDTQYTLCVVRARF